MAALPNPTFFPSKQYRLPVIDFSVHKNVPFSQISEGPLVGLHSYPHYHRCNTHDHTAANSRLTQDGLEAVPQPR